MPPPYSFFISNANAQNNSDLAAIKKAEVARRAAVLIDHKKAKFTAKELIEAVNDSKNNGQLKKLLGEPESAQPLMHRAPTPQEVALIERDPELPIAKLFRYVVVNYADNASRGKAVGQLRKQAEVAAVVEDEDLAFSALPTEKDYPGFLGTAASDSGQWGMHFMRFPEAWDKVRGRAWVTAVDNGVQENHPDIIPNYRKHLSFSSFLRYFDQPDEKKAPLLTSGHGTHVASTIAAAHNNSGIVGGCPECSFVALRTGGNLLFTASEIVRAVDIGSQVINMSYETPTQRQHNCLSTDINLPICLALNHAKSNGVTLVASAGNYGNRIEGDNGTPHLSLFPLPATHPDVLAISGLRWDSEIVSFWAGANNPPVSINPIFGSNFGDFRANGTPEISFAAPARRVVAAVYQNENWSAPGNAESCGDGANPTNSTTSDGVGYCTGTSMSAPHVSAMAGLVKSANPLLATDDVKAVLRQSSECLGSTSQCTAAADMRKQGYGVPKADKAVQLAIGGPTAKNRVTPLFAYFNATGDNHFYTTNPQMAIAAKRNTLQPAPRYKFSPASVNCATSASACLTNIPGRTDMFINQSINTLLPDGQPNSSGVDLQVVFEAKPNPAGSVAVRADDATFGGSQLRKFPNYGDATFTLVPNSLGTNITLTPLSISTYPLQYQEIGLPIPGMKTLPCGRTYAANLSTVGVLSCDATWQARAIALFLTTHQDPTNTGKTLKKVHRLSCAPENLSCNTASGAKKAFHVTFQYTTSDSEVQTLKNSGYNLDGAEGYAYDPLGTQPAGTQMLCARRNTLREDYVLFLDTTTTTCTGANSDAYATQAGFDGSGYNDQLGTKIGYVYPVSYLSQDSDGDGLTDAVEMAEGRNPAAKDNNFIDTPNDHRLFVQQQYRDFLGREAEAAGQYDWERYLTSGGYSRAKVTEAFLNSPEFGSFIPPIVRLYLGYFKRTPDHAGLWGWYDIYRSETMSLAMISNAFSQSAEFVQTYGGLTNSQFVTLVYQNVLNRTPSQGEINDWLSLMNSGYSRGDVMLGFTDSGEFKAQSANRVTVISTYEGMLRRAGEDSGVNAWVNYMNNGNNVQALINGFLGSLEYRYRFLN